MIHSEDNADAFNLVYDDLRKIYPTFSIGNLEGFVLDIKEAELTNNLYEKSETLAERIELAFKETVDISETRLSSRDKEEEISIDSIYSYFDEFKVRLKSQVSEDERWIDEEESLSEEEKLALYAAYLNILEFIDSIVDESLEYLLTGGSFEVDGEKDIKSRFFRKLINKFKRIVNGAATLVKHVVVHTIPGALIGAASFIGPAYGAILGYGFGLMRGWNCIRSQSAACMVCVFCQSNPRRACYCE